MLQFVTSEHVAAQPGFAPHSTSQLAPPLQPHAKPLQMQVGPAQVGRAWGTHAPSRTIPTEIESKNEPIHGDPVRTRRDSSNPPSSRRA